MQVNKVEVQFTRAGKRLAVKFEKMRKADEVVGMKQDDGNLYFQGDRMIGVVDPVTGKCVLNYKGSNPKYNIHLSRALGAEVVELPADFVDALKQVIIGPGHEIGPGVIMAGVKEEACQLSKRHPHHHAQCGNCLLEWTCKTHNVFFYVTGTPVACSKAQDAALAGTVHT